MVEVSFISEFRFGVISWFWISRLIAKFCNASIWIIITLRSFATDVNGPLILLEALISDCMSSGASFVSSSLIEVTMS